MSSNQQMAPLPAVIGWNMPIGPEHYDRKPLTDEERRTLDFLRNNRAHGGPDPRSKEARAARRTLDRLNQPVVDVFRLRHQGNSEEMLRDTQHLIQLEMLRRGTAFWQWSEQEWLDILCPTRAIFSTTHGVGYGIIRTSLLDDAYLLGGVTDLRSVGIGLQISTAAKTYFGAERLSQQSERVMNALASKGYANGEHNIRLLQQCLSMLFVLNRSPYLEALSEHLLAEVATEGKRMRHMCQRIAIGLHQLQILQPPMKKGRPVSHFFEHSGIAPEWYEWSVAWYEQVVDLTPHMRRQSIGRLLAIGRWLSERAPEVITPAQWTEDLALRFRVDVCSWTAGQYASAAGHRRWDTRTKDHARLLAERGADDSTTPQARPGYRRSQRY